ncbi:MAG: cardiolipin synthase [bacterium]
MSPFGEVLRNFWPQITALLTITISVVTAGHAILYKRDSRATVGWVGLIWLAPVVGSLLYVLLGVNRVRRRATVRRGTDRRTIRPLENWTCTPAELKEHLEHSHRHLVEMAHLSHRLTGLSLMRGNRVEPLIDGDSAYPAMLEAINSARKSVTLTSYIFAHDSVGARFLEALSKAIKRGVYVRVLVDAVGARYSTTPITGALRHRGIRTATFMSGLFLWRMPYFNLRNHRKILVVDGHTGFTGGMNIRSNCMLSEHPPFPTRDIHFLVEGPVVEQLQSCFVDDWYFTTGERLSGHLWFPEQHYAAGSVLARGISDGPDHDMDKMGMAFHGALSVARKSVRILTPYFLPDRSLIAAINTCAMRGVAVDIVIPSKNNLKMVAWACMSQLWQVLEWDARVWMSPPPFDHSKILIVDDTYTLLGSSNWDPRSLRLNFEFGMESYDAELARRLAQEFDTRRRASVQVRKQDVDSRTLPIKLRDGVARLFSPYL